MKFRSLSYSFIFTGKSQLTRVSGNSLASQTDTSKLQLNWDPLENNVSFLLLQDLECKRSALLPLILQQTIRFLSIFLPPLYNNFDDENLLNTFAVSTGDLLSDGNVMSDFSPLQKIFGFGFLRMSNLHVIFRLQVDRR